MLCDASPLLRERSWHKPYCNGIQKQRSVSEVLIAFTKTLTKELKWQKLPFPLKVHIKNQNILIITEVYTASKGLYRDRASGLGKTTSVVFFRGFCIRDETLHCFHLCKFVILFLSFLLSLCSLQRTGRLLILS